MGEDFVMLHSSNTIAVPPGATIREQLENREMTQKDFAQRMDMSEKHISQLINGKEELTQETALRLELVLGIPAKFWTGLEALYREKLARVKTELAMEQDVELASNFPYAQMAALGWVEQTRKNVEKVENLRAFFEVTRLGLLRNLRVPGIAYRINGENEKSDYALAVWAQQAKLEARKATVAEINIVKLKDAIPQIRDLTVLSPEEFCPKLRDILAECGIAIVFLPHINGSFLHGASFIDGKHIVLGLTVRGRDADKFWFSLFHELYHILEGHINNINATTDEQEKMADNFARDTLIIQEEYDNFVAKADFSRSAVITFAQENNIATGIVVGRLQKEKHIPYSWYHDLKIQYQII